MRRVREMQSGRATRPSRQLNTPDQEKPESKEAHREETLAEGKLRSEKSSDMSPLGGLFKDKEKLLILLLIMLLSQEGTNTELVLALLYIII